MKFSYLLLKKIEVWANILVFPLQEWIFFLNEGSEIDISYSVKSKGSVLFLVIAEGRLKISYVSVLSEALFSYLLHVFEI